MSLCRSEANTSYEADRWTRRNAASQRIQGRLSLVSDPRISDVHSKYTSLVFRSKSTSSLSLPIKSSSGRASCRCPLPLCAWSSPFSIFSWSPWPCPRLGEWGCDEKLNTSSCRVSWGSDPSLLSQLLQACRSRGNAARGGHEGGSDVGVVSLKMSFVGLRLKSSEKKKKKKGSRRI